MTASTAIILLSLKIGFGLSAGLIAVIALVLGAGKLIELATARFKSKR